MHYSCRFLVNCSVVGLLVSRSSNINLIRNVNDKEIVMKKFNKKTLALITSIAFVTAFSGQANAGAKTYSHLLINNFTASDGSGAQYDASDFSTLDIGNFSDTFASTVNHGNDLNFSKAGGSVDVTDGFGNPDDNASCVGFGCAVNNKYEDVYSMQASPLNNSFMRSDTELLGALITGLDLSPGTQQDFVTASTVAEGQTEVTDSGTGSGLVGNGTQVSFSGSDDTITFAFDADAMLQVLLHQDNVDAYAALEFSISIFNETENIEVFSFAPDEINQSLTQLIEGSKIYTYDNRFSKTTDVLSSEHSFTLSINHGSIARFDAVKPVPEPSALALFGLALMGFASTRRRKANTAL